MTVGLRTVRGIALPITLLVASILVVLAAWMLMQGSQSLTLVGNDIQGQASLYAAEAGLTFARAQLAQTQTWGQPSPLPSSAGAAGSWDTVPAGASSVPYAYSAGSQAETLQYTVMVTNNSGVNNYGGVAALTTQSGVSVPLGTVYLLVTAQSSTGRFLRSAAQLVSVQSVLYQAGVEAVGAVIFSGHGHTGFYNSSGAATPNGGSVASINGPFSFSGSSTVNGNLYGPGSAAWASDITGTAFPAPINPAWASLQSAPPGPGSPDVSYPGGTATLLPGTYGSLTTSANASLYLQPGGTYVVNNVDLSGGSQVIVPSPCPAPILVYFYGSLNISGGSGSSISNSVAINLQFIQAGAATSGRTVSLSGGTSTVGVIDAPTLPVTISGNGNLEGAVVGASITDSGDGHVDYDESLGSQGNGTVTVLNYRRF